MRIDSTDGVTLAVHDLGGDGEALVVCHAAGFHAHAYAPLARHLAATRKVVALDFRAHGDSTSPGTRRFSWDGVTDDLLAVVDALGLHGVEVFGHSLGGAVALLAEARRPGTVRRAYVYEPIVLPGPPPWNAGEHPLAVAAARRRSSFGSKAEALWRYASRPPLDSLNAAALLAYVDHGFAALADGTVALKLAPEDEAAIFNGTGLATVETIAGLAPPTRVAVGAIGATPTPASFGSAVAAALADGELRPFPHLGHFGPLEAPAEVAADLLDWLAC